MPFRDEDNAELDPREFPEPDRGIHDSVDMVPCPYCRKWLHEEAVRCHHCGNYLSREDAPVRRPLWFVIGVLLCLAVAVGWALWG